MGRSAHRWRGWHNNHHAHPSAPATASHEVDVNYYGIWFLSKIGLAKRVQIAKYDKQNPKPAGA